ncbi:MAG: ABC transporter permease [Alphaproteobacteria bacterium]|nr:ABC transporter permease [Alphaproteobacteria bacterium]
MKSVSQKRWTIFCKNKPAVICLWFLLVILILSLLSPILANDKPLIVKYDDHFYMPIVQNLTDEQLGGNLPTAADYTDSFTREQIQQHGWQLTAPIPYTAQTIDYFATQPFPIAPSQKHWLGTDDQGRDLLARILYALRLNLIFGILLTLVASFIGFCIGAVQGYFGGKTDLAIGRFIEIWGSLPQLFILIILAGFLKLNFWTLLLILVLFSWPNLTSVVRAEFLRTRGLDYVRAAKAMGASDISIMFRHILPNALIATTTYLPFILSGAIVALSALDFLGLGLPPGTPSLGEIIREAKENLNAPWIGFSVFIIMTLLLAALLLIGDGVRTAFDPHTKEDK